MNYGGNPIHKLTDKLLLIAESDVANCLQRAFAAPDEPGYNSYYESLQGMALEIAAEKTARSIG